jgi:hypothetical protein
VRIYVASSWRNPYQQDVVRVLRSAGHDVYDFRNPAPGNDGFRWTAIEPAPRPWDVDTYRRVMAHPIAAQGHALDFGAMNWCQVCVLVLPAGRSASWELGWCMGAGKRGVLLQLQPEEPELMFRDATIAGSLAEMLDAVDGLPL